MKRLPGLALVIVLVSLAIPLPATAKRNTDVIKVMTRNLYLGADIGPVIAADPVDFFDEAKKALEQVGRNLFPVRAAAFAREVAFTGPDVIALQEVLDFKVNGEEVFPFYVNHLDVTLNALRARGLHYKVAATVNNLDLTIPLDGNLVSILDRDVILVKKGLFFENIDLCGVPVPNPLRVPPFDMPELISATSMEGCNYTVAAPFIAPDGTEVRVERGFVGIDVWVRGHCYRVVNTHLEVQFPDPDDWNSAILQYLQSVELVETLRETSFDKDLILLGDFNSSPVHPPIGPIKPPYQVIADEDFSDVWDTNPFARFDPKGFTCCEPPDLANRSTTQYERIDIIFVRGGAYRSWALVTGRFPIFPLFFPPNWASDHGGVFGKLFFKRW
jgi:endonuclease/exonuclease/phosphatase family metal-dependent hydrolase